MELAIPKLKPTLKLTLNSENTACVTISTLFNCILITILAYTSYFDLTTSLQNLYYIMINSINFDYSCYSLVSMTSATVQNLKKTGGENIT